jgi:hypothetical protein
MTAQPRRYLSVEAPDTAATVDFLGEYGFSLKVSTTTNGRGEPEVYVIVQADDDQGTILGEIVAAVPKSCRP